MAADRTTDGWGPGRHASVRLRTTLGASAVVAVALVVGGLLFIGLLERSLTESLAGSLRSRASDLRALIETGVLPTAIIDEPSDEEFLQVLAHDGDVLAASTALRGTPPLRVSDGEAASVSVPSDDEPFLAYATSVASDDDAIRLIVGRSLEPVLETTALVGSLLAVALPLVVLLVGGITWAVVGRALAPVERMRREVAAISAAELHRRLPPPTARDEIGRLAETMNQMLDRLDAASQRQREFVSDTSHELRSPIAAIRQQAEVALAHPDRIDPKEFAESVLADDLRLQRLVEDLLLLARADEYSLRLRFRAVDVDDLVFEVAGAMRRTDAVRVDTSDVSPARARGDEAALRRVVGNLADNAERHAAGTVAFSLRETDGEVVLAVDDDGAGIPEAHRQRVFERFVRLDEARSRDRGGVGLGLSVVHDIVAAHGGRVSVDASELGGARFEVRLPAFSVASGSVG